MSTETQSILGEPISKAAMLRQLVPGTKLTLVNTTPLGNPLHKRRTVHKVTNHHLVVHVDDKPDRPLSYLTFSAGDKFYVSATGFTVVSDVTVSYLWGHHENAPGGNHEQSAH
ncbi:MAG: hypothetical protein ACHRXM_27410 [Isosphaerales bacterium]